MGLEISLREGWEAFPRKGIVAAMRGRPSKREISFPNRLREWRERRGLTLKELAAVNNITAQAAQRHETGENPMSSLQMARYAQLLDIRIEELLLDSQRITTPKLRALLDLASNLPEEDLDRLIRLGAALAEPSKDVKSG